ncbi:hypothetical protein BLOT_014995 [Blomia tropicalis]|nr:hypothetical protein BLOT_014995 [Blomia tropicalis]
MDQHYENSKQIFIESIPFGPMKQTKKFILKLYLRREKITYLNEVNITSNSNFKEIKEKLFQDI